MFTGQTLVKLGGAEISKPSILVDFWHFLGKKPNVTYTNFVSARTVASECHFRFKKKTQAGITHHSENLLSPHPYGRIIGIFLYMLR